MEVTQERALVAYENRDAVQPIPTDQLTAQVRAIQEILRTVMVENEHWGVIPGTGKPTLYKAGAEKLCVAFRLAPEYTVALHRETGDHREYQVSARLIHIPTGTFVGAGVGLCSTMERKYRYRKMKIATGLAVPRDYWNDRDPGILRACVEANRDKLEMIALSSQNVSYGTVKEDNRWQISVNVETENPDLADTYNTVLKMAKKRALVDAVLTATAASDIFTQDLEDISEFANRETLHAKLIRKASEAGWGRAEILQVIGSEHGLTDIAELTDDQCLELLARIERKQNEMQ